MSNSYAQPIFRTAELADGLSIVDQLLGLADTSGLEVDFEARARSQQDLDPLFAALPAADRWTEENGDGLSATANSSSPHLPAWLQSWGMAPDIVPALLPAVGGIPAALRWDFAGWPEAPEAGLGGGGSRGAFVTLCMNVRDLDLTEPSADHTVFVHVKQFEAERAPWLAARVGCRVIGDLVMAPH
ncbi:hypothetical protein ACFWZ2_10155 [Streptomyces sp. NPDC059002]|uniref:hypothetical protein n=1 Tax=Streptomyces sp. NPDC059002 TaxID=3346690 RepID=UPI00369561A8